MMVATIAALLGTGQASTALGDVSSGKGNFAETFSQQVLGSMNAVAPTGSNDSAAQPQSRKDEKPSNGFKANPDIITDPKCEPVSCNAPALEKGDYSGSPKENIGNISIPALPTGRGVLLFRIQRAVHQPAKGTEVTTSAPGLNASNVGSDKAIVNGSKIDQNDSPPGGGQPEIKLQESTSQMSAIDEVPPLSALNVSSASGKLSAQVRAQKNLIVDATESQGVSATKSSKKQKNASAGKAELMKGSDATGSAVTAINRSTISQTTQGEVSGAISGATVIVANNVQQKLPTTQGIPGLDVSTNPQIAAVKPSAADAKRSKQAACAPKANGGDAPPSSGDGRTSASNVQETQRSIAPTTVTSDDALKSQSSSASAAPSHSVNLSGGVPGVAGGIVVHDPVVHDSVIAAPATTGSRDAGHLAGAHAALDDQSSAASTMSGFVDMGHRTIAATPTVLEVGVRSGTQGWLKVRAELASGGLIDASLSTTSQTGQDSLHHELPSLTAFLQQERVVVNTVVVHPVAPGAEARDVSRDFSGGSMAQSQQRNEGRGQYRPDRDGHASTRTDYDASIMAGMAGVEGLLPSVQYAGGGWLSVRA